MSNVKTDKKGGTRGVPPPTNEGDQGRVTAETVVTEGRRGMERFIDLARRIVSAPIPSSRGESGETEEPSNS